jgi:TatD DNase family protein
MDFVDTHCHLNDAQFDPDRDAVWGRAQAAGVRRLVCIGADRAGSHRAALMTAEWPGLYAAIGIHPESGAEWNPETAAEFTALAKTTPGIVAYGEIGLDYHWDTLPRPRQQTVFAEQIAFAETLAPNLPLVIHCRDAQDDVLAILRESATSARIIMHCFTGDSAAARAVLDAGCFLGIGGVVTFKRSDALRQVVADAPLDRILLETDCPYLAPQAWRGRRNEPSYLTAVAETVASVKGVSVEIIAEQTTENAMRLFRL